MREPKKTCSERSKDTMKSVRRRDTLKTQKKPSRIIIQAGESDDVAMREFINECLVPILAEQFMNGKESKLE
jgi:hypothetical protein